MQHLPASFFLQMAAILVACRIVGWLGRKLGQPQVVGEMIAGVLLGPSLFGYAFPELSSKLFTQETRGMLFIGAQLGIGLYMFLVGMEFSTKLFRSRARSAASVSIAGMVIPFILGALLTPWLIQVPGLFSPQVKLHEAGLFLGASIAITAFPMLARIIYERGLTGTPLGTLALAAGAIDDAAAWCVLAIVLASFTGDIASAWVTIGGAIVFTTFVLTVGKRALKSLGDIAEREGHVNPALMAIILTLFCLAAWFTDTIGIHTVFGGFVLGIAMPRGVVTKDLTKKLEPFTLAFLLPIFFTYSGLNTRLDLLLQPSLMLVAVAILIASTVGKGVACWAAARLGGEDNRTALAVGALMNSRGLMELIIINIGFQKGLIGQGLFAILVIMTVVTTLMTSPVFEWVYGREARRKGELALGGIGE